MDDLIKRLEAATGPWRTDPGYTCDVLGGDGKDVAETALSQPYRRPIDICEANAALIAAAPDIARAYMEQCETVARLTEERDRLREAMRKYGRHVERCGVVGECVCGLDAALGKEG